MSTKIGITAIIISLVSLCCSVVCLVFALTANNNTAQNNTAPKEEEYSKQYVMYVGTNDKDTYKLEITEEEAKRIVDEVCLQYFEGYTLQEATGAWTDESKNITHEYTLVCYFDDTDKETVYKAANDLIKKLNQNTVLIEEDNIRMEYYSGQ